MPCARRLDTEALHGMKPMLFGCLGARAVDVVFCVEKDREVYVTKPSYATRNSSRDSGRI
jgi:hypothetical protein